MPVFVAGPAERPASKPTIRFRLMSEAAVLLMVGTEYYQQFVNVPMGPEKGRSPLEA